MGKVIVSLDEQYEDKLRRFAAELHGNRKGSIKKTVEYALDLVEQELGRREAINRQQALMEQGLGFVCDHGVAYLRREDIYE